MSNPMQVQSEREPLDVTVYLHIESAPDAFHCEIVAGPASDSHTFYDDLREVLVRTDLRELKRYTLIAARTASRHSKIAQQRVLACLAEWIAAVLRNLTGAERAAVIALSDHRSKGLHWLIAPLGDDHHEAVSVPLLGIEHTIVPLKESAVPRLAGRLQRALA